MDKIIEFQANNNSLNQLKHSFEEMRKVLQIHHSFDIPSGEWSIDLSLVRDVYDCFSDILAKFESDYGGGVIKSEPLDNEDSNIL